MQTWTAIIIIIQNGIMKHESLMKADYALLICLQKRRDFLCSECFEFSFDVTDKFQWSCSVIHYKAKAIISKEWNE